MADLTAALPALPEHPQNFAFPVTGQSVRSFVFNGEPWFVAADVAAALELGNPRQAVASLDEDEVRLVPVTTNDGSDRTLPTNIVSEPGLYSLILRSRKPQAKAFKRWITHDVIPAIRKTGGYGVANTPVLPQSYADALRELASTVEAKERAEAHAAELEPAAHAWDALASTGRDYSAREAAYILNRDPSITTGQNLLLGKIRQFAMVDPFDRPYAQHKTHLTLRPQSYTDSDGVEQEARPQVRITYAGLKYLHKRLGGTSQLRIEAGEAR